MTIKNFDVQLLDEDGKPEVMDGKPLTALFIVQKSLTAILPDDKVDGEEKYKRYELRQRVNKGGDIELSPEEITLIKSQIGKVFGVNAVGQLYKILNS